MESVKISKLNGFYQNNITVKFTLFICDVYHIIHKRTKEITLAKLKDLNGSFLLSGHFS